MIRGLIFDFDGLIVDTESPDYLAWRDLCAEYGCDLPIDLWSSGIGRNAGTAVFSPMTHLERHLGRSLDRETLRRRKRERYIRLVEAEPVRPGVAEYIADARRLGLRLGVATSSGDGWATGNLSRLGLLSAFDCVRCATDVARAKPYPDLYFATLECLGIAAGEAIALEDSPSGATAALAAGVFCVVVPNGMTRGLAFPSGCLRLESLVDVPLATLLRQATERLEG